MTVSRCCAWAVSFWFCGGALAFAAGELTSNATTEIPIKNPGFEEGASGGKTPAGWTFNWQSTHQSDAKREIQKQEPDWGWDRTIAHSGAASVRCGVSRPQDDGVWTQEGIAAPAGARYLKLSAWCRARDVKGGVGSVGVVFLDAAGKFLGANYTAIAVTQDCDWTRYTGYAEFPRGPVSALRLRLWTNFSYSGAGTFWFDDIELATVDQMVRPMTVYLDETPAPALTAEERERGFMLFSRGPLRLVFPNTVPLPEERVAALRVRACRGEREPAVVVVRALAELKDVRVTVSELRRQGGAGAIPASAIDTRSVRFLVREGQSRWGPFNETQMEVPLFLEQREAMALPAHRNQPFWLTIHVPAETSAGVYEGAATIETEQASGAKTSARVPLKVEVLPFDLAGPKGMMFGLYERIRQTPGWNEASFADMRAHGMTGVGLFGTSYLALTLDGGKVRIDWNGQSAFERAMNAYARAGFPEPALWLMSGDIAKFCLQAGPLESDAFAAAYRSLVEAVIAHGKQAGWPEIIFQPVDEPFEHADRLTQAKRLLEILKTIPGVRTEEDGMNGRMENFTEDFYRLTDVFALHDGPVLQRKRLDLAAWDKYRAKALADGKTLWFYNIDLSGWRPEPLRYMLGFGLWKSKATGVIEWSYMSNVKEDNPAAIYKDTRALAFHFPPAPGEGGGPTIAYEAMREGVDDYRYLLTLRQLVDRAQASGKAGVARRAEELWRAVQDKLDAATLKNCEGSAGQGDWTGKCEILPDGTRAARGDHKIDNGWAFGDYDALREQLARGIAELQGRL